MKTDQELAEEMAKAPTSELIDIIVESALEVHEQALHDTAYSQTEQRGDAARRELDARLPARPWWTSPG